MRPADAFAIGLDHSTIPMPIGAEEEARAFYGGVLQFPEVPKPPTLIVNGGVWYQFEDGRQLHLQVEEPFAPMANPHPAFRVERIEAFAQAILDAGFRVEWDDRLLPRRRFYTFDPFGNRLEMIEP
jgi:muramoyltetrapeptide carboxypeptidase